MARKIPGNKQEKVADVLGSRRPFLGATLLFIGVILALACFDYKPGQPVLFWQNTLVPTTKILSPNICGSVGATICALGYWVFGVGLLMIIALIFRNGILAFKRSVKLMPTSIAVSMIFCVVSLCVLAAIFQRMFFPDAKITELSSDRFVNGWGGIIGQDLFESLLHPLINVSGSAILFTTVYLFCLLVLFVESPLQICKDTWALFKKTPKLLIQIPKLIWRGIKAVAIMIASKELAQHENFDYENLKNLEKENQEEDEDFEEYKEEEVEIVKTPIIESEPESDGFLDDIVISKPFKDEDFDSIITKATEEKDALFVDEYKPEKLEKSSKKKTKGDYRFPSIDLLSPPAPVAKENLEDYQARMNDIIRTLSEFKIDVKSAGVFPGPVITRYEVKPAPGVKISKISQLENDIALNIAAESVRVIAPVPGKGTVGIEVPNKIKQHVCLREVLQSSAWNATKADIPVVLGKDVTGNSIVLDLAKMPHALVAGTTGSGKSVCINGIIASLLFHSSPEDLRFIMVDPKVVELNTYNSLPHMITPVITDSKKVPAALKWLLAEMKTRYDVFKECGVKNIAAFNAKILHDKEEEAKAQELESSLSSEERIAIASISEEDESDENSKDLEIPDKKYPYIVCIIDELADLMMVAGKEIEALIMRLTQVGRAAGIHLLVATQRPSTNIITGVIKANLPTRIAFKVSALVDSRTILDAKGAETLIGRGDMLFVPPGSSDLVRAQGAFLSDDEITNIVEFLKVNGEPEFIDEIQEQMDSVDKEDGDSEDGDSGNGDEMSRAIEIIRTTKKASISMLQRKMSIGYGKAARIMDDLEAQGKVGPDNGPGKPRDIYL